MKFAKRKRTESVDYMTQARPCEDVKSECFKSINTPEDTPMGRFYSLKGDESTRSLIIKGEFSLETQR